MWRRSSHECTVGDDAVFRPHSTRYKTSVDARPKPDSQADVILNLTDTHELPSTSHIMISHVLRAIAVLSLLSVGLATCTGTATYNLTVRNVWTEERFGTLPEGAEFSPLAFFSHSPRFSSLVLYGYATQGVQDIAEAGDITALLEELEDAGDFVKDVDATAGGAGPGQSFSAVVTVDCERHFVSALTMVAPSPDWFIAIANMNVLRGETFVPARSGVLRVYDAGTDSGETFLAQDEVTQPRQNIAPLGAPFNGRVVAKYHLKRIE